MNFSTNYLLYPDNRALELAITASIGMLTDDVAMAAIPDRSVAVADKFRYTRGNFEQNRYSSRIFEALAEALQSSLAYDEHIQDPLARAATQNNLGNILAALGQQRWDVELFERAVQCFNSALKEVTQDGSPNEWAATQYNLATASQALGRLLEATGPLKIAVDAYTSALMVWSRDSAAENWMLTMHQLGATLHTYGTLLKGNRQLQKSVVAFKNALAALDADNHALELAATHNNRAAALHHLGESENNPERIEEAIRSYEKALTVSMEQQLPIHVAVLCRVNKATAQNVLAELTSNAQLAEETADEFDVIIECFSHALQPLCLKHCQTQLAKAGSLTLAADAGR